MHSRCCHTVTFSSRPHTSIDFFFKAGRRSNRSIPDSAACLVDTHQACLQTRPQGSLVLDITPPFPFHPPPTPCSSPPPPPTPPNTPPPPNTPGHSWTLPPPPLQAWNASILSCSLLKTDTGTRSKHIYKTTLLCFVLFFTSVLLVKLVKLAVILLSDS